MKLLVDIANRITSICDKKSLTYVQLAVLSGVPASTLGSIISKKSKNPGIVTLSKICNGFGMSVAEFFNTESFK